MSVTLVNPIFDTILNPIDDSKGLILSTNSSSSLTFATLSFNNTANRIYSIPEVGTSTSFVLTDGNQTINDTKTFSGTINISPLTANTPLQLDGSKNIISSNINLTTQVTGTLPASNGGTGQSSYTIGDILYASGVSSLSRLADVATGNALISGGIGVAPSYGKIGLTTHVSGTLPIANGIE